MQAWPAVANKGGKRHAAVASRLASTVSLNTNELNQKTKQTRLDYLSPPGKFTFVPKYLFITNNIREDVRPDEGHKRSLLCAPSSICKSSASDVNDDGKLSGFYVDLRAGDAGDVLAIGRALKARRILTYMHEVLAIGQGAGQQSTFEKARPRAQGLPPAPAPRREDAPLLNICFEHMLASAGAPGRRRGLDQRDDARLLPHAAAKSGGVCERDDESAAGCGVGRVVARRAGAGDDCG